MHKNDEMEKIVDTCKECKHKATDSCRDSYWWICGHESFEIGAEPIIDPDKPPIKECPLVKLCSENGEINAKNM